MIVFEKILATKGAQRDAIKAIKIIITTFLLIALLLVIIEIII